MKKFTDKQISKSLDKQKKAFEELTEAFNQLYNREYIKAKKRSEERTKKIKEFLKDEDDR